jgi:hypothetical protein
MATFFVPDPRSGRPLAGERAVRARESLRASVERGDGGERKVTERLIHALRFRWSDGVERVATVGAPDPFEGTLTIAAIFEVAGDGCVICGQSGRWGTSLIPVGRGEVCEIDNFDLP